MEGEKLGGVCLNKGCIPSKTLIATATLYDKMKEADSFGINLGTSPVYDWSAMINRKDKIVSMLVGGIGQLFKSHGVDHIEGYGKITGKNEVTVVAEDGTEIKLKADNIIVATGSRSRNLPTFPIDGTRILTSDHMLQAESLPKSIIIIGAGVIGCEWACLLSMLDVEVTVVEMLDHALPLEDAGVAKVFERELKKKKITLYTKTSVDKVEPGPEGVQAILSNGKTIQGNQILVAVGRAFNTEEIGLEDVGVKLNRNGSIPTNNQMRTNIKNIYAIGDVRGEILLAYTAVHDGSIAVDTILGEKVKKNYAGVPSVIFTSPEVASVGMTEQSASEKHEITIGKFPMRTLGKAHAENEISGEVKMIADKKTDKLLGVHIVGAHATEIIHTAALAINRGLTATQVGALTFGHPVISESIMEAAHDIHGLSVHLAKKKR